MDELIKQAQAGNTQALEALWEQTMRFASTVLRRFHPTVCVDSDDLQQCGWLGFYAAVQKHDGRYHFLTLMDFCIRAECQQALRIRTQKQRRDIPTVSFDVPAPDGEQAMVDLFVDESLSDHDERLIGADLVRDVRAAVAELPEREQYILTRHWFDDIPLHRVGNELSISHERARQLEQRAFERLRRDPVLCTYAPRRVPSSSIKSGLQRFLNTQQSCVEQDALNLVQNELRRTKRQSNAYSDLLRSLAADGYMSANELETLLEG